MRMRPSAASTASGPAPDGPAAAALISAILRITAMARVLAMTYAVLQVVIWHSFYAGGAALLWAPALVVTWGGLAAWYLLGRRPRWPLVCLDSAVYAGLALSAAGCEPPGLRGLPGSWLFIILTSQVIAPVWFARWALSVPLALLPVFCFAAGHVTAGRERLSVVLLCVVVAAHWCGRWLLSRHAATADAAAADAGAQAHEQYVALSRALARREQDRLLHDTVLNTLTAVTRSGAAAGVAGRCRHDMGLLAQALHEPAGSPPGGLLGRLSGVAAEMRARGLTVNLSPAAAPAEVPGPVAEALANATREALANVAAHAGTSEAWVTVSPGVQVTIRDAGRGFDHSAAGPARLGVRRSIRERMADCGGLAEVQSVPGTGTVVRLRWPAPGTGRLAAVSATAHQQDPPC